jgi:molybdopterin synthase sulfur carrier subunit
LIRVKFFAYLRDYTSCSQIDVPAVPTIDDLTRNLSGQFGSKLRDAMLTADGEMGPNIIIMINGRHVFHLGGLSAQLKDDDTVQIFPKVAGG